MRCIKGLVGAVGLLAATAVNAEEPTEPEPVQVMVLGLYHFDNPGLDVVNPTIDDMLAPKRQREIERLVDSLANWAPTKVAVENEASAPSFEIEDFARADELMTSSRNETVQIGFRLAQQLGHDAVYGYDERSGEGEPDYFPIGKVQKSAAENGQSAIIEQLLDEVREETAQQDAQREQQTVAQSLIPHNDGEQLAAKHDRLYYSLIQIGDGDAQPGAELNAYWYMRNAKMFGKIDMIVEPGDRVLVIAGSGHATWLRHFAERMPGYELVETMPYLIGADTKSEAEAN
ncbi:DUF5694 domain-containing protein [Erythrobacter sp. YT30]|uniref:DUF5694 domain-containing protein n=1 Tax=Erythrobacter sp. YT30 TaxID=1735012 RepID=UPI00076D9D9C|nr:DUF5694 domain-containing protein [Erythrobacter sp. YT30]KWV91029.1 hypothetical protein AUC45_06830 [Erythrobacter sp. YT30]